MVQSAQNRCRVGQTLRATQRCRLRKSARELPIRDRQASLNSHVAPFPEGKSSAAGDELSVARGCVSGPRRRTMQQRCVWASGGSDLRDQELADQHDHPEQTERNE